MKKILCMLVMMFVFHLYAGDIQPMHTQTKIDSHTAKLVEVVLTLPFEGLIINQEGIAVNYEGNLLAVHSLERSGEYWVVRAGGYCPNGHRIVCRCGGCAISSCGYSCSCYSDDYKRAS